jgi:hypothetical protein
MKTFEKNYIGKGKQIGQMQIVKFSFKLSEITKFTHVFDGEDYLTFEVAKLKNTDSFGHNYTAYVNKLVETPETQPSQVNEPAKKTRKIKNYKTDKTGKILRGNLPQVRQIGKSPGRSKIPAPCLKYLFLIT